jgi:G3E family GTPase
VFQGVHETLRYGPADSPWHKDEPRMNQVVFIGYNLNRKVSQALNPAVHGHACLA